jgi:hypothetical protein
MPGHDGDAGPTAQLAGTSAKATCPRSVISAIALSKRFAKDLELELVLHVVIRLKIRADLDAPGAST